MKNTITIFYDSNDVCIDYNEFRQIIFECEAEENNWKNVNEVPESKIWEEFNNIEDTAWDSFICNMSELLTKNTYLLTGVCGRWNGPSACGKFIKSIGHLLDCIVHLDRVRFYDENGHLKIWGYHHDGEDYYELKRLTRKGIDFATRNCFAHNKKLHEIIMTNRAYSALPSLAQKMKVICI